MVSFKMEKSIIEEEEEEENINYPEFINNINRN